MLKHSKLLIWLGLMTPVFCRADFPPLDCILEPNRVVNISSAAEGLIEKVHVDRNDTVEKGQKLVELQAGVERATLALALARAAITSEVEATRASLALSERRHHRVDQLYNQQVVSLEEKDQLATEHDLAVIKVRQAADKRRLAALESVKADELLKLRTIRSPIDGVVTRRHRSEGEFANEEPLLTLAELDPLRVEVIVPAELHGLMQSGMQAEVMLESLHAGAYPATITTVDRVVDAASGTFDVRLRMANPDYAIPAGLRCQVRFLPDAPAPAATIASETGGNIETGSANHVPPRPISVDMIAPVVDETSVATEAAVITQNTALQTAEQIQHGLCRSVGPIEDVARVEEISAQLPDQVIDVRTREVTESVIDGHLVLVLAGGGRDTVENILSKLATVSDKFALTKGPYKGHISVGFYHQKSAAERRRLEIAQFGVNVGVRTRIREEPRFWMDVDFAEGFSELSLLEAVQRVAPKASVALGPCNTNEHLAQRISAN